MCSNRAPIAPHMRAGYVLLAKFQPGSKIRPDTTDGNSNMRSVQMEDPDTHRTEWRMMCIGHSDSAKHQSQILANRIMETCGCERCDNWWTQAKR